MHSPSVDDLVLSELGGAVYYYHHDHLNSTVAVTDSNGSVVEQYRYDVYGHPSFYGPDGAPRGESAIGLRFLFTGREWLRSLGLYDYRGRAHSLSLGRFLQMDPLVFLGEDVNLYRYGLNKLIYQSDPFGLRTLVLPVSVCTQTGRARCDRQAHAEENLLWVRIYLPSRNCRWHWLSPSSSTMGGGSQTAGVQMSNQPRPQCSKKPLVYRLQCVQKILVRNRGIESSG